MGSGFFVIVTGVNWFFPLQLVIVHDLAAIALVGLGFLMSGIVLRIVIGRKQPAAAKP